MVTARETDLLASKLTSACAISDNQPIVGRCSVGYEGVQQALRELLIWPLRFEKQGQELGLRWPRGCLLHGPPGVGKTLLVNVCCPCWKVLPS
jgi:SpoVK/Ycf46/Vps4 family AAA+-type ATPase